MSAIYVPSQIPDINLLPGQLPGATMFDHLQRADGALGISDSGHTWVAWGGHIPQISNHRIIIPSIDRITPNATNAGYPTINLGDGKKCRINGCWFTVQPGSNNPDYGTLTLLTSPDQLYVTGNPSSLANLGPSHYTHFKIFQDKWIFQVHIPNENEYVNYSTGSYRFRLKDDGTTRYFAAAIWGENGNENSVRLYLPDGSWTPILTTPMAGEPTNGPTLAESNGNFCIYEPFVSNGSAGETGPEFQVIEPLAWTDDNETNIPQKGLTVFDMARILAPFNYQVTQEIVIPKNTAAGTFKIATTSRVSEMGGLLRIFTKNSDGSAEASAGADLEVRFLHSAPGKMGAFTQYMCGPSNGINQIRTSDSGVNGNFQLEVILAGVVTDDIHIQLTGLRAPKMLASPISGSTALTSQFTFTTEIGGFKYACGGTTPDTNNHLNLGNNFKIIAAGGGPNNSFIAQAGSIYGGSALYPRCPVLYKEQTGSGGTTNQKWRGAGAGRTPTDITANYTIVDADGANPGRIPCDCTSNAIVITLPDPATWGNTPIQIRKKDSSSNKVSFTGFNIQGSSSLTLNAQYDVIQISSDGTSWMIDFKTIS